MLTDPSEPASTHLPPLPSRPAEGPFPGAALASPSDRQIVGPQNLARGRSSPTAASTPTLVDAMAQHLGLAVAVEIGERGPGAGTDEVERNR